MKLSNTKVDYVGYLKVLGHSQLLSYIQTGHRALANPVVMFFFFLPRH